MESGSGISIQRIISGGQTGVDRAALDVALNLGIDCGGWCPAERWAEDGPILDHYPLQETESAHPADRTGMNVSDADGTLIMINGEMDTGTKLTLELCHRFEKPHLLIDFTGRASRDELLEWLRMNEIACLNIAGPRESKSPGIYTLTKGFLLMAFRTRGEV